MKGINCTSCGKPFNHYAWGKTIVTCTKCLKKPRQKSQTYSKGGLNSNKGASRNIDIHKREQQQYGVYGVSRGMLKNIKRYENYDASIHIPRNPFPTRPARPPVGWSTKKPKGYRR